MVEKMYDEKRKTLQTACLQGFHLAKGGRILPIDSCGLRDPTSSRGAMHPLASVGRCPFDASLLRPPDALGIKSGYSPVGLITLGHLNTPI